MAVGPQPDVNGNITATAPCVACGGITSQVDPQRHKNYQRPSAETSPPVAVPISNTQR